MSKIFVDEIAGIVSADTVAIPGHVIQVVSDQMGARFSTSSQSFVTTSIGASITPTNADNKILVLITSTYSTEGSARTQYVTMYRDSTNLGGSEGMIQNYNSAGVQRSCVTMSLLDSPNTTSEVTYSLAHKAGGSYVVEIVPFNNALSTVVLMEIAG